MVETNQRRMALVAHEILNPLTSIRGSLDLLEKDPPAMGAAPDYGHVTIAAALGYLDFRHQGRWRAAHPKMVAWLHAFSKAVPASEKTRPAG